MVQEEEILGIRRTGCWMRWTGTDGTWIGRSVGQILLTDVVAGTHMCVCACVLYVFPMNVYIYCLNICIV